MYICNVNSIKVYISVFFVSLLLLGVIDFHGLSHLLESHELEKQEICEECNFIFQQKEDTQYFVGPSTVDIPESKNTEFTLQYGCVKQPIFTHQVYPSDYYNKPPPNLA